MAREALHPLDGAGSTTVINATGVIIHTNLGRAVLSTAAQQALEAVARGYSPVEFNLENGARGRRGASVEHLLCQATGAEAALVVNNCAAATVLMLMALTQDRAVVISRGQLVEIGGGFRIPEITPPASSNRSPRPVVFFDCAAETWPSPPEEDGSSSQITKG